MNDAFAWLAMVRTLMKPLFLLNVSLKVFLAASYSATKNDGTAGIDGEHGLVANSVAACKRCPFAFLLGALGGEDVLVAFLDQSVCTSSDFETDGVECTLEVKELGLGAHDSVDEAERSRFRSLDRRDCDALAGNIDFDVYIRTDIDSSAVFSLCLCCELVKLESLDCFFRESDEATDVHFDNYVFHLHLFFLLFVVLTIK